MADLDDFFAKKDRKKSKGKKFATTEELAKKLDEPPKKEKPTRKERESAEDKSPGESEQDEWREFEEEKKDYTGLKIGNLNINTTTESTNPNLENTDEQQCVSDEASSGTDKSGPWKRVTDSTEEKEEKKPQEPAVLTVTTPNVVGGTYVPPNMRNVQPREPLQAARLRTKAAPDIHSEKYFPTLAGGKGDKKGRSDGAFEVVAQGKSSSLHRMEQARNNATGPKLSLGNRYNTLSNDS